MFARQIRQGGLAVASMAFAVTVLVSPAAPTMAQEYADSIETVPVSLSVGEAETVLAGPTLPDLPTADLQVWLLASEGDQFKRNWTVKYRLKNNGPERARFNVTEEEEFRSAVSPGYVVKKNTYAYILDAGEQREPTVYCFIQAGLHEFCRSVKVKVTVNGIDPNLSNNQFEWYHPNN